MIVICESYFSIPCRIKNTEKKPHEFNFRLNMKFNIDGTHKRHQYFGKNYKRFDKKLNKINTHSYFRNLKKR